MSKFEQRVMASHRALGIAPDYAARSALPLFAEPEELVAVGNDIFDRPRQLAPRAAAAWRQMCDAAAADAVVLQLVSAWRSLDYQHQLIAAKLQRGQTLAQILQVNAAPGFSEHHSGRAVDLTSPGCEPLSEGFENTHAFRWLQDLAADFGFRMTYPRNNPWGISYEPWHWCWHEKPQ